MNGTEEEAQKHLGTHQYIAKLPQQITDSYRAIYLDHCVEHVRLALWCGADISPISLSVDERGRSQRKGWICAHVP